MPAATPGDDCKHLQRHLHEDIHAPTNDPASAPADASRLGTAAWHDAIGFSIIPACPAVRAKPGPAIPAS